MTTKNMYAVAATIALVLAGIGYFLYLERTGLFAGTTVDESWTGNTASSTQQILIGTIDTIDGDSVTILVRQPSALETAVVVFGSSTPITKQVPKSQAELAAAFQEFQRLQKESGGKSFTPPSTSDIVTINPSDLKVGDSVIITLEPEPGPGKFEAISILVVPAQ